MEFKKPKITFEDFDKKKAEDKKKSTIRTRINSFMRGLLLVGIVIIFLVVWKGNGMHLDKLIEVDSLPWNTNTKDYKEAGDVSRKTVLEEESASISAVKKVSPSVVSIIIKKDLSSYYNLEDPFFPFNNFFFPNNSPKNNQPEGKRQVGGGTGFIISEDGLILTNKHVVSDEDAEYTVVTNDGEKYEAVILGRDLFNDIAIVKIEAKKLPVVDLGDSDELQLGQTVIAIGNSLGEYRNTVTKGVVSGIGRRVEASGMMGASEIIEEAIQTDAAINPGNSGGPLINLSGEVIGINTAINQQGQLIGFAIPVNEAKQIITSVIKNGRIIRPFLGVRYILLNEQIAKANKLDVNYGALIIRGKEVSDLAVVPGSPADKANIVENDIILEVDENGISKDYNLTKAISKYQPGDKVNLKIWHKGEEKNIEVVLDEYKN